MNKTNWRELCDTVTQKRFFLNIKTGDVWQELEMASSDPPQKFYYNAQTNETTWEQPKDPTVPVADVGDPDWKQFYDATQQKPYYVNSRTNVSSWTRPHNLVVAPPLPPPGDPPELPPHWKQSVDPATGRVYYSNTVTNESAWALPGAPRSQRPAGAPPVPPRQPPAPESHTNPSEQPSLPTPLMHAISQFQVASFTKTHFETHRKGLLNRKVKQSKLLQFSRTKIDKPLLKSTNNPERAIELFCCIQNYMGDIDVVPKEWAEHRARFCQWIVELGLEDPSIRDELFSQLQKQLTSNPNPESEAKGWELLRFCLSLFPPSSSFDFYIKNYLESVMKESSEGSQRPVFARKCLHFLAQSVKNGVRVYMPPFRELAAMREHLLHDIVFCARLEDIMSTQSLTHPGLEVPRVFTWLIDQIRQRGGLTADGIYQRAPANPSLLDALRQGIVRGQYCLPQGTDPILLCAMLKLWLRELSEPVVPFHYYDICVHASLEYKDLILIIEQLPRVNQLIIRQLIRLCQDIVANQSENHMTPEALATVVAPDIIRKQHQDASDVQSAISETQITRQFVWTLILHMGK